MDDKDRKDNEWALRDFLLIVAVLAFAIPFFAHVVASIARAIPT